MSEIPLVLSECRRVLRDSGRICVVAMSGRGKPTLATRLYAWAHDVFPHYVDCRPIFLTKTLEEAGLRVTDIVEMSTWGLPVDIALARRT
jgi:demethylmenaquinone methyltransferase/2-methoxy-6-polyprenyl-1,4-benzoquinol methylase